MKTTSRLRYILAPFAGLLLALLTACQSPPVVSPADPGRTGDPVAAEVFTPSSALAQLNIDLQARGRGETPSSVVAEVRNEVAGALAANRFHITANNPDLILDLAVETELLDRSGNYYVFRGIADSRVLRRGDSEVIANRILETRGERRLGEPQALRALGTELGRDTADWLRSTLTVDATGIAANDIEISLSRSTRIDEYSRLFIQEARNTPGIISCVLIDQDPSRRAVTFRVVYFPREIPEGVLNRLSANPRLTLR